MNPARKRQLPTLLSEATGTPRRSKRIASQTGFREVSPSTTVADKDSLFADDDHDQLLTIGTGKHFLSKPHLIHRRPAAALLPNEVLSLIFRCLASSWIFRPIPKSPLSARIELLQCALVCRNWSSVALQTMHQAHYISKVIPRIEMPQLTQALANHTSEWSYVCMMALVCLHRPEWNMGAPRLFYIDRSRLLQTIFPGQHYTQTSRSSLSSFSSSAEALASSVNTTKLLDSQDLPEHDEARLVKLFALRHPNPADPAWSTIVACSMDVQDTFIELATGKPCNSFETTTIDSDDVVDTQLAQVNAQPDACFHRSAIEDSHQHTMALNSFKLDEYFKVTRKPNVNGLDRLLASQVSATIADISMLAPPFNIHTPGPVVPGSPSTGSHSAHHSSIVPYSSHADKSVLANTHFKKSHTFPTDAVENVTLTEFSGKLIPNQYHIPMMMRYSERMDIGCFFVFINLGANRGSILLRAKPVGLLSDATPFGNGSLVLWDDRAYGCCSRCRRRLLRVQVCADCRIAQFCSRACQKHDWDSGHRTICRTLGLQYAISPADLIMDPRNEPQI
ncbi:hypothetical protein QVD99_007005 [Batrachochytrium dendrobatidis]|nr:hypothetical protein O5D80_007724 [Batrachochytrium dendrobatidis]KAK5666239.1 hypothetical protein QVD99_007005 [Batrachochytrium dendrobatidis]